jgi:hypothetical protein
MATVLHPILRNAVFALVKLRSRRYSEIEPGTTNHGGLMIGPAKIVVRYENGSLLKGYAQDFSPGAQYFHVRPEGAGTSEPPTRVIMKELKAVFFVRDFAGNGGYKEEKSFASGKPLSGRKLEVTFQDGEVLVGTTTGYEPNRPGFFLFPADEKSNNVRMYIVAKSVRSVRFV